MEDAMEALRAENAALKEEIALCMRMGELALIFLGFVVAIVVSTVFALREEFLRLWRQYEEVVLLAHHKSRDRLMRIHDNFNLIVLPIVVILDARFVFGGNLDTHSNPKFWNFLWFTVAYIVIDMFWVAIHPKCVKSQVTILAHHAVTLLYMGIPLFNPVTRYAMAVCLSVEVNTWFLILRRTPLAQNSLRLIVAVPFYFTWYSIRLVLYPYMIYDVFKLFRNHVESLRAAGDPSWERASYGITYMAIPPVFQTCLTLLNIHWSVQLIKSNLRNKGPDKGL